MTPADQRAAAVVRWRRAVRAVRKDRQAAADLLAGMIAGAPGPRPGILKTSLEEIAFPLLTAFLREREGKRRRR